MTPSMKVLANLGLRGWLEFGPPVSAFPTNPSIGQTCFKDGILYLYTNVDGWTTWYPLNRKQQSYVHVQGVASLQWTVNHGLGTKNVVVAIYDDNGEEMHGAVQSLHTPTNPEGQQYQVIVTLTEAMTGIAVVFAAENDSISSSSGEFTQVAVAESLTVAGNEVLTTGDNFDMGEF